MLFEAKIVSPKKKFLFSRVENDEFALADFMVGKEPEKR